MSLAISVQNSTSFRKSIIAISGVTTTEGSEPVDVESNTQNINQFSLLSIPMAVSEQIYSPTVDLGRDLELIIIRCLAEKANSEVAKDTTMDSMATDSAVDSSDVAMDSSVDTEDWVMVKEDEQVSNEDNTENCTDAPIEDDTCVCDDEPVMSWKHYEAKQDDDIYAKYTPKSHKKITNTKQKDIKSKKRKNRGENKKWKSVGLDNLGFDLSLFPWQNPVEQHVTTEMDIELKKFEAECDNCESDKVKSDKVESESESAVSESAAEQSKSADSKDQSISKYSNVSDNYNDEHNCDHGYHDGLYCYYCSDTFFHDDFWPIEINLERWIWDDHSIAMIEKLTGNLHGGAQRRRSKKKWRIEKGRKQAKTKYCRSMTNSTHGVTYYMHHRKFKLIPMPTDRCSRCNVRDRVSIRAIDKKWDKIQKEQGTKLVANPTVANPTYSAPRLAAKRNQPRPAHTLTAFNADGALEADLVNILMLLQERDVMPEDYDLLLRLDERVKAKTVDKNIIDNMKTDTVTEPIEELCAICLEAYIIGHIRRYLPCGHGFHDDCTIQWLNTSTKCPLDGLEVSQ